MNKIKYILHRLYIKWVKGQCRHFCKLCEFKEWCKDDEF